MTEGIIQKVIKQKQSEYSFGNGQLFNNTYYDRIMKEFIRELQQELINEIEKNCYTETFFLTPEYKVRKITVEELIGETK